MSNVRHQPAVLNLVMLGTNHHRETTHNILTEFARSLEVSADHSVHLIDGLGGWPSADSTSDPMVGTYDFRCEYDPKTGQISSTKTAKPGRVVSQLSGLVFGTGVTDIIREALMVVEAMRNNGKSPIVINMYGYSRGGDTALRLSNILNALYPDDEISVNIFAIDPVPGPARRKAKKARLVPDNVLDYTGVLMAQETRPIFEPQDRMQLSVQNPKTTKITHHILYGSHTMATKLFDPNLAESAYLLWDSIQSYAVNKGTRFRGGKQMAYVIRESRNSEVYISAPNPDPVTRLSDQERLKLYTKMKVKEPDYEEHVVFYGNLRDCVHRKRDYFFHGVEFFVDAQHMALFKKEYPHFFDYYFQQNVTGSSLLSISGDVQKIKDQDPELLQLLIDAKIYVPGRNRPKGIPVDSEAILSHPEIKRIWFALQSITHPVLAGYDKSVSKEFAQEIYSRVYRIICSAQTDQEKIAAIQKLLIRVCILNMEHGLYAYKLAGVIGQGKIVSDIALRMLGGMLANENVKKDVKLYGYVQVCYANVRNTVNDQNLSDYEKKRMITTLVQSLHEMVKDQPKTKARINIINSTYGFIRYQNVELAMTNRVMKRLDRYINRFKWFGLRGGSAKAQAKENVAELTKTYLLRLQLLKAGDDNRAIAEILTLALRAVGKIHGPGRDTESALADELRKSLLELSHSPTYFTESPPGVKEMIQSFKAELREPQVGLFTVPAATPVVPSSNLPPSPNLS